MVEYTLVLDDIFGSLADTTRRDILQRLTTRELTVSEVAEPYNMSLAAVSKHLKILERGRLIRKQRRGRTQLVSASPVALQTAAAYFKGYETLWNERFDALDSLLKKEDL